MMASGSTTLPVVLLSLAPSFCHQPWVRMVLGSGAPRACSMIGQYTAWNLRMSLPMRWMSAGQSDSAELAGESVPRAASAVGSPRDAGMEK